MVSLVDEALISVSAGKGGKGIASFHRTRSNPKGGPDGGNGGDGGSVFAESSGNVRTLRSLKLYPALRAKNGKSGGSRLKSGRRGDDVVVKVPLGTIIRDEETSYLHADLNKSEMRVMLARGGQGGFGNAHFKSSTNRRPTECTEGFEGESRRFLLELRLLADVGIIGLPNAGKSSLLAALTRANPKIANYPFTTLEPNLGVIADNDCEVVVADIPGLIEGAVEGAGHGNRFLRHIFRTSLLWHVIDVSNARSLKELDKDISLIRHELSQFEGGVLAEKPCWLVYSKMDICDESLRDGIHAMERKKSRGERIFAVSAATKEGLPKLRQAILEHAHGSA